MESLPEKAAHNLAMVREKKPLIHNITNYVAMNYTANALLAMGASPVMAHSFDEVEEMVSQAGALILNIGTLTESWITSMLKAGKKASELGTSVLLDPVGAGATSFRTNSAKKIIKETHISVIRGNPSEILALSDHDVKTKGVESIHTVEEAAEPGKNMAHKLKATVAITGVADLITDGNQVIRVWNGHPLMGYVTATGCIATATIGAFLAVDDNPFSASVTALSFLGLAGEVAGEKASAPGSFMIEMLNALYTITPEALMDGCKIKEE
ncbi:MAG: hydroxyethylthiazole kinase [Deltaproteobacteria bacterium]|nr:hydroxyethylthiazole kinase [Deltaproteobacteria bacterium]